MAREWATKKDGRYDGDERMEGAMRCRDGSGVKRGLVDNYTNMKRRRRRPVASAWPAAVVGRLPPVSLTSSRLSGPSLHTQSH